MNRKLRYITEHENRYLKPLEIPNNLIKNLLSNFWDIDRNNKIIYHLAKNGIGSVFYDSDEAIQNHKRSILVYDFSIIGFRFDSGRYFLVYYNKTSVKMIHTITKVKKTIYTVDDSKIIYFVKINSFNG